MEGTRSGAREMAMRILYQVSVFEKAKASYDLDEMFMDIEGRNKEFIENIVNEVILKREELDNNKEMNKLLKDNSSKMEIAKEIQSNKKISEIVGDRLARKRHFPPC